MGKDGHHGGIFAATQARAVVPVYHRTARKDGSKAVGVECNGKMLPVHQVGTDGMAPVHGSPYIAIGIVLVEEVVFPFIEDHAIGIVRPHGVGAKMELGTVLFGVAELRDPGFIIFLCGTRRKEE